MSWSSSSVLTCPMPGRPSPPPDARRPRPPARRPMPLARRPLPRAPCPTLYTRRSTLIYPPPPTARRLRTRLHTRTPSDTATRVILARGVRRLATCHDPSSTTGSLPHTAPLRGSKEGCASVFWCAHAIKAFRFTRLFQAHHMAAMTFFGLFGGRGATTLTLRSNDRRSTTTCMQYSADKRRGMVRAL